MLSIHGQDKPYVCPHCDNFFKTKQEFSQHSFMCAKKREADRDLEDKLMDQKVIHQYYFRGVEY